MDEMTQANRLNQDWDALLGNARRPIDPAFERTLLLLHNLNEAPSPTPAFADRLWENLQEIRPARPTRNRGNASWLAIAAVLALVLITSAVIGVLRNDDDAPQRQVALATQPVSPTNTPAAGSTPSAPAWETSGIAGMPPPDVPTSTSSATSEPPSATPTVDPNATVPTGPTPVVQFGGGPVYETLEQMVNASDLIAIAHVTDEVLTLDEGHTLRAVTVERVLRGDPATRVYIGDQGEFEVGSQYVLFMNEIPAIHEDTYGVFGVLQIEEDIILAGEDGFGSPVQLQYGGQPVDLLAADIATIPEITPIAEGLLEQYGWTPLNSLSVWPGSLPAREEFERGSVLPHMPYSWEVVLDASKRIGLDFSALAGQDTQVLVYLVEREPTEPRERAIWAGLLIHSQTVVGAWIVVSETERPYGLDERDTVLEVPRFIPTPEPTPTIAIPSSEAVNPAKFYLLAETDTFTFCWPYCDEEPKTVGLRNAIIAALDHELPIQPLDVRPTPTHASGITPSDGTFVYIVFGHLTPGWNAFAFGYDRDAQLLLLPHNAGWVPAPAELIEIMAGIEPPPVPTKSR